MFDLDPEVGLNMAVRRKIPEPDTNLITCIRPADDRQSLCKPKHAPRGGRRHVGPLDTPKFAALKNNILQALST